MIKMFNLICICILTSSCSIFDCGEDNKERSGLNQFSERKSQWQGNEIKNYVLSYEVSCFCDGGLKEVTVTNGNVSKVVIKDNNGEVTRQVPENEYQEYYTVPELFDLIAEKDKTVDKLKIEYDSALGYPKTIDVDPYAYRCDCSGSCSSTVDDEYTYHISVSLNS